MAEAKYKSFQEALNEVLTEISEREKEEDRLVSQKPMKIKFKKDFLTSDGKVLVAAGSEQMVSEVAMLAYKKLGVANKVGR